MERPPAFFEADPPYWAARGLGYLLIGIFAAAVLGAMTLRIPETVSCPFVLVPGPAGDGALQAELTVSQAGVGRLKPGQDVKLLYDAFPYQRYGVRYATLRSIDPAGTPANPHFRALADVRDQEVWTDREARPLRPGMTGTARIVLGSRPLFRYAVDPVRKLRENLASPPSPRAAP